MKSSIKKIIIIIFILIIIAGVVIVLFSKIGNNEEELTSYIYNEICNNENYTCTISVENSEINYVLTVVKQLENMCIDVVSEDDHTATLLKDGYLYYVMHQDEEYYLYESEDVDINILKEEFQEIEDKEYTKGKEEINGEKYYYEEYEGIESFAILLNYEEESEVKTRFYYKNNELKYIKTITSEEEELLKIEFSDTYDESYLEIPSNYAENAFIS